MNKRQGLAPEQNIGLRDEKNGYRSTWGWGMSETKALVIKLLESLAREG
jgi:hypothetical protein